MILMAVNIVAVTWFGELESFFSMIKILGIFLFILLGIGMSILVFSYPSYRSQRKFWTDR